MRKLIVAAGAAIVLVGVLFYTGVLGGGGGAASGGAPSGGSAAGAFARPPMTVELAKITRRDIAEHLVVVGNLIGALTVEVAPKVSGRVRAISVRLGDSVAHGQVIAKIEDAEIIEQVKQAEASFEVAKATIRQREADLKFAETSLERSRNLYARQLLPKQTLDDSEARYQAALAQLDLSRAQFTQAGSRVDELRITRANTTIESPVDGFVGRRHLDPGAFASTNTPIVSVVDIHLVRLVVNLVEKDLRRVPEGAIGAVDVDAFPGESFEGRVARIAPVLDPATRTAEIEIEIANPRYRLKPGMYARVRLTVARRENAIAVPRNALMDLEGKRGVFVPEGGQGEAQAQAPTQAGRPGTPSGTAPGGAGAAPGGGPARPSQRARFVLVETGISDADYIEVTRGLSEGQMIVTTGAAALKDGDAIQLAGPRGGRTAQQPGQPAGAPGGSPPSGTQQAQRR